MESHTQADEVVEKLKQFAYSKPEIRALVLTSSRSGNADAPVDQFSDYDVVVYVSSLDTFHSDNWLNFFGNILVKWPLKPDSEFGENWLTRLVMFENRTRIDFQITTETQTPPLDYDLGYRVLLDKDGLTQHFPKATKTKFLIQKPSEKEFLEMVNAFFWDSIYVPKYLYRNDVFYRKYMFDVDLRFEHLEKMIQWYIGCQNDWSVNTNVHGRLFPKYLDDKTWKSIEETFVGVNKESEWQAFIKMVEVFTSLAREVASKCGYSYPLEQEKKMLNYYQQSKNIPQ